MKIIVSYSVDFVAEIPKEKILDAIKDNQDSLNLGERLNELAKEFCPAITPTLDAACDAELSGVYQKWMRGDKPYTYILPEDDIDEVIWES